MFKPMVVDIYHGDQVQDLKATAAAGVRGIIHKASQGVGVGDRDYEPVARSRVSSGCSGAPITSPPTRTSTTMLLLIDIDQNTRRTRALLESEAG